MEYSSQPHRTRRAIRLRGYDYRQSGVYFITVCTYQHANTFGWIAAGEMRLSRLGEIVEDQWQHIARARAGIQLDSFTVMPNHVHGLIVIDGTFDGGDSNAAPIERAACSSTLQARSLGAIVGHFKAAVTRNAKRLGLPCNQQIWQRNYYEHIVRNEKSLNEIRAYIQANPARWHEDFLYKD